MAKLNAIDFNLHHKQGIALSTMANEVLFGGSCGGGKSHLMRYSSVLFCMSIPGLQVYLFRRKYADLQKNHLFGPTGYAAIAESLKDKKIMKINYSDNRIDFSNGSKIFLCHCQHEQDMFNYQGAEIHLLMVDELTHFTNTIYSFLRSRVRLGGFQIDYENLKKTFNFMGPGYFPRILTGTNPGGVGHAWVKQAWVDAAPVYTIWKTSPKDGGMNRVYIPATMMDNPTLMAQDPSYVDRLNGLADPATAEAMRTGNWDIISGGAIDDLWDRTIHIIKPFKVPKDWMVYRTFDWGSAKPFAVCYFAESNGNPITTIDGKEMHTPPGTVFLVNEIYGWNGDANTGCKWSARRVGDFIRRFENKLHYKNQIVPGAADSSIWANLGAREDHESILDNVIYGYNEGYNELDEDGNQKPRLHIDSYVNNLFEKADKSPGSRIKGLELLRSYLESSKQVPMEHKGFFVTENCKHFIRTVPVLPRSDTNPEDVDTEAEDHIFDCTRYQLLTKIDHFHRLEVMGI